jgi:outer membrane receptor for Fe3+-dicitrate
MSNYLQPLRQDFGEACNLGRGQHAPKPRQVVSQPPETRTSTQRIRAALDNVLGITARERESTTSPTRLHSGFTGSKNRKHASDLLNGNYHVGKTLMPILT